MTSDLKEHFENTADKLLTRIDEQTVVDKDTAQMAKWYAEAAQLCAIGSSIPFDPSNDTTPGESNPIGGLPDLLPPQERTIDEGPDL